MKKPLLKLMVLGVSLMGLSAAAADMKEMPAGLWQITSKMDMPGMPPEMAAKMANGMTATQCVKPGEMKWNEQRTPVMPRGEKCDPVQPKVDGNTVTWSFKCVDGTAGDGKLTHNGKDAYKMKMNVNSPRGSMTMNMEGKKIADTCEKAAK
jgi:hypothetical protein